MANQDFRFQIRHGNPTEAGKEGIPEGSLKPYELGWAYNNGLYMGYTKEDKTAGIFRIVPYGINSFYKEITEKGYLPLSGGVLSDNLTLSPTDETDETAYITKRKIESTYYRAKTYISERGFAILGIGSLGDDSKWHQFAYLAVGKGTDGVIYASVSGQKIVTETRGIAPQATSDASGNIIANTYANKITTTAQEFASSIKISGTGNRYYHVNCSSGWSVQLGIRNRSGDTSGLCGIYSASYNNGTEKVETGTWMLYRNESGNVILNGSADKATKDGSGNTITSTYLKLTGGTLTGALEINYNGEVTGTPTLSIGPASGAHIEIDENEIQAMTNSTTTTGLYINNNGGPISIGHSDYNLNLNGCIVLSSANFGSSVPTTAGRLYFKTS